MTMISNNVIGQSQTKKALLIIDIQKDFTGENAKMPVDSIQGIKMITNLNKIIDKSKELDLTVIYIGNEYSKFDILNVFRNFASIKGSDGAKLDDRLHLATKNYFPKNKGSAFSNPNLDKFLKEQNIAEIFISGLYAEACIYGTTKGAIRNNYLTTVLTDCIATKTDAKRNKMIEKFKNLGAKTITSKRF
jgi:nicotinamidase-related amidase